MMLRHFEKSKRTKGNENDVEENATLNKGNKQFGPSSLNKAFGSRTSDALKSKSNNQKDPLKNTNEKQKLQVFNEKSTIQTKNPLKRSEAASGPIQQSESKRQNIQPVERTYRHREEEIEWTPAGLDIDLNVFEGGISASDYHVKENTFKEELDEDAFLVDRQFNTEPDLKELEFVSEEQPILEEIEHDMSTVEYGPPREKEIEYKPEENCIVDVSDFCGYVDLDCYELMRLFDKDTEFILYEDQDALDQLTIELIDDDALEFRYDLSDFDQEVDTTLEDDYSDASFQNHHFDVDYYTQALQCT